MYPVPQKKRSRRLVAPGPLISYPCGFFDGATAKNIGGVGFVIRMVLLIPSIFLWAVAEVQTPELSFWLCGPSLW